MKKEMVTFALNNISGAFLIIIIIIRSLNFDNQLNTIQSLSFESIAIDMSSLTCITFINDMSSFIALAKIVSTAVRENILCMKGPGQVSMTYYDLHMDNLLLDKSTLGVLIGQAVLTARLNCLVIIFIFFFSRLAVNVLCPYYCNLQAFLFH